MSITALSTKADFITDILNDDIDLILDNSEHVDFEYVGNVPQKKKYVPNINRCKSCKLKFNSIIQHLKKNKKCGQEYSEEDMKLKKAEVELESKALKLRKMREKYEIDKSEILEKRKKYHSENKKEISKKKADYNERSKDEISLRNAKYYEEKQDSIKKNRKKRYAIKLVEKEEDKRSKYKSSKESLITSPESQIGTTNEKYIMKRKPVKLSMADLEEGKEEEDGDFKCGYSTPTKKILPKRKCAENIRFQYDSDV